MARIERQKAKPTEPEEILRLRPRRSTVTKEFALKGGWIFNPPESCTRRKMDSDKQFSVETCMCAYYCKENIRCKAYEFLMEGSKSRKKFTAEENQNGTI